MLSAYLPALVAAAALVAGAACLVGLGLLRPAALRMQIGLATTDNLKWREFAHLVSELLRRRGFEPARSDGDGIDRAFDLRVERGNQRYLVQIKQGRTTRVQASHLRELRAAIATEGAAGGLVVTSGSVERSAFQARGGMTVEILHGVAFWKELQPLLEGSLRSEIERSIGRGLLLRGAACVLVAMLTAALAWWLLAAPTQPTAAQRTERPSPSPPPPLPAAAPAPSEASPSPALQGFREVPQLTDEETQLRRAQAVMDIAGFEGVESVAWMTRSTLLLQIATTDPQVRQLLSDRVCTRLVEYEELRYTRLQIEEPGDRVRWAQCQ